MAVRAEAFAIDSRPDRAGDVQPGVSGASL